MRISKVKSKFKQDFVMNFYNFDENEVHQKIKREIFLQSLPDINYQEKEKKPFKLIFITRIMALFLVVLTLMLVDLLYENNKRNYVDVNDLFKAVHVEYSPEPIIVSTSFAGEELRIYKGFVKEDGLIKIHYYYFYNEVETSKVSHLYFINRDLNISIMVDTNNNFGNLSKLLNINVNNNIEVIIVYENSETYSQVFVANQICMLCPS